MAKKNSKTVAPAVSTKDDEKERQVAIEKALKKIEKDFGKGAIMKLGDKADQQVSVISSGSLAVDVALGVGGYPRGRIVEIYGPESSGKTTVALHAIAAVQKSGGKAAFIDAEHALDPTYATKLGVDIENLYFSQPDSGEQGLAITEDLVVSGGFDLVVVDSVAALVPRNEIDGEMGDSHVGLQARMMSQALRKLSGNINKTNTIVIFINQLREKVGVMFGNPETTPGGRALKFYATIRLDVRGGQAVKEGSDVIGKEVKIKVVKNKVAPPFKIAESQIVFGEGISPIAELIKMGSDIDVVKKAGAWYSFNGERLGQGLEKSKIFLEEHPEMLEEVNHKVRVAYGVEEGTDEEKAELGELLEKSKGKSKTKKSKDEEETVEEVVEAMVVVEDDEPLIEQEELPLD